MEREANVASVQNLKFWSNSVMAIKINAGEVKRSDLYSVDPFQIVVKEELRGRWSPPTEQMIVDMALSMMENGQRQPVEVRKIAEDKLLLVLGFTRTAAARLIRTGFTHEEVFHQDEQFKLKCSLTDANDQKAFINNIVENAHRNNTSPIDDAMNHHKLRDSYGFSDTDIAKLYQQGSNPDKTVNVSKVGRLRRLLALPEEAKLLIHTGKLAVQAALDILDIEDEEVRNNMLQQVYTDCGAGESVSGATIRSKIRDVILNDDSKTDAEKAESATAAGKKAIKPRSMKEIRTFFGELQENHVDEAVKEFSKQLLAWVDGKKSDKVMGKAVEAFLDAQRS
jgi:ParB-like chromosome segregation protein Spo0J